MKKNANTSFRIIGIALIVVILAVIIFSSYTIVGPGMRGVVVMLGKVEETSLGEGFHLVLPPVMRQVIEVDIRTKKVELVTEAASADLQTMMVTGILNYHLDPPNVGKLYQEVGLNYEQIIIVPTMQQAIKEATSGYKVEAVLVERAALRKQIQDALNERLGETYIIVDQVSLANIEFSEEFNLAIERKQVAEQGALQKQYELQAAQKDVEISLARAEGEKKAAVIAAEGRAEARRLEAQAEADALALLADQLKDNPELIQYEWAVKLSPGVSTVLLPSDSNLLIDSSTLR